MAHDHSHPLGPIDIHAHFYPPGYLQVIRDHGGGFGAEVSDSGKGPAIKVNEIVTQPLHPRFTDLDARIQAMDEQGVQIHALSLSLPMVEWADAQVGLRLAAATNDAIAAAHSRHPTRLYGLATLPWHAPELAIAELERAARLPGVRGVYAPTKVRDLELSHASLLPIYERIEALGLAIFLHPVSVIGHARLTQYYLTNLLGNPFESAIAAAHLIFGGIFDRFPKLVVCLPHAGGAFPYLVGRLQRGYDVRQDLKHIQHGPMDYLRRFYYDTVGYAREHHEYLVRLVGSDRVMMGSDYCFPIAYEQPAKIVTEHPTWDAVQKHAILEGNARRLLKL